MSSKLIVLLSGVMGVFFLYAGVCKIYPVLDQDLHLSMKKHFVNYARVAPLRSNFNLKFKASQYRSMVGSLEIVGGFGLLFMTGPTARNIGFAMLVIAELMMVHSYQALGDPVRKYVRVIAAVVLLTAQMYIEKWYIGGNESNDSSSSSSSPSSSLSSSSSSSHKRKDKKSSKNKDVSSGEGKKES